jgi:hypothetical protein
VNYANTDLLWPLSFDEMFTIGLPRIEVSDIASYAYPPFTRARYASLGWGKALNLMVELGIPLPADDLDVRDFGAISEGDAT